MARKSRACKCGARTSREHTAYVLAGGKVHTYGGPR